MVDRCDMLLLLEYAEKTNKKCKDKKKRIFEGGSVALKLFYPYFSYHLHKRYRNFDINFQKNCLYKIFI